MFLLILHLLIEFTIMHLKRFTQGRIMATRNRFT